MDKEIALNLILSQRVVLPNECWEWTGPKRGNGYGGVSYNGVNYYVHRLSAFYYHGLDLESDLSVLHYNFCHNRMCFNPLHIYVGTQSDNMKDRVELITHCVNGHEFNEENTYIQARTGKRQCRKCKANRMQKSRSAPLYY